MPTESGQRDQPSNASSYTFSIAKPDPLCTALDDAYRCIKATCPRGYFLPRWYAENMKRLVLRPVCGPSSDENNSTKFSDEMEDFNKNFGAALEESSCLQPVDDANAYCKQAVDCTFNSVYKPIIHTSSYLWYVKEWTAVIVKLLYAINHNNKFVDENIPECRENSVESGSSSRVKPSGWTVFEGTSTSVFAFICKHLRKATMRPS